VLLIEVSVVPMPSPYQELMLILHRASRFIAAQLMLPCADKDSCS
jgi:hypothetical protein